ncbi:glucose-6-phosphate dehydrogenase [Paenibacillus hemerocallicola]|uniref:Glucose-6-phosphate 1-dehydrogenase n=1 Tax=Paenibacillus hemerocallicola TaxID=1172614 RepID=A0A5C4TFQ9_9BACL|nr:glucose-6-phosphate dehydrogenase [Paenibacillus hemerocallicola]TNJ67808.1 glucose-6-phosphate dehydrogenase [Paenibacillus hemerocallicola]
MESSTFILFGATGDLAKRKIYPALYHLFVEQKLPPTFSLIGLGRREWSDELFRANVKQSLLQFSRREAKDPALLNAFLRAFRYCILDAGHIEDYRKLLRLIEQREAELGLSPNRLFYLSVGPEFFDTIAANIRESGLGSADGWKRLVIEKPFGHDLQSARDLNRKLNQAFEEHEIFRIDHYLGKPMVQKLEVLHQTDPVLRELWTNRRIANVQITANETVGVEERAGYYDHAGAVRDMFQNHMLQLLMMLAVHFPNDNTSGNARLKKKKVMEVLEPLQKQEASANVIRGQYKEGSVQGKPVTAYTSEPGIDHASMNDTFIAAKLRIDDSFWGETPFYIRTGKRMREKSTRIVIEFKDTETPASPTKDGSRAPNLLVIEIGPGEGITLHFDKKRPGQKEQVIPIPVDFPANGDDVPEAYENLIFDALRGDPAFFAHWDEVELSWKWVQPILEAFEENLVPLRPYAAGTYGPVESDKLLAEDGFHWWLDAEPEQEPDIKKGEHYAYHTNH